VGKAFRLAVVVVAVIFVIAMLANGADFDPSTKTLGVF